MIMIDNYDADKIRAGRDHTDCGGSVEYGYRETVVGSGRAICRVCGQKILKGQVAYRFPWDISGCGSFTATNVQIHADDCNSKQNK
jgi:hypothetical protein